MGQGVIPVFQSLPMGTLVPIIIKRWEQPCDPSFQTHPTPLAAICPNRLWHHCCSSCLYHRSHRAVESSWLPMHPQSLAVHNGVLQGAAGRGLLPLGCPWNSRTLMKEWSNVTRSCFNSYACPVFQQCLKVPASFGSTLEKGLAFCRC